MPIIIDCQPMTELTQETCLKNPLSAIALAADEFILVSSFEDEDQTKICFRKE